MTDIKLTAAQAKFMAIPMETIVLETAISSKSPLIPHNDKGYWKTLSVPDEFDGRTEWNIQKPDNQGECGSCWAYASVMALNDRFNIIGRINIDLSVAQTVLCDWKGRDVDRREGDARTIFKQLESDRINEEVLRDIACFGNTLYDVWRHLFVWGTTTEKCVPKGVMREKKISSDEPLCAKIIGSSFDMCVGSYIDPQTRVEHGIPARFYRCLSFYMVPGVETSGGSELTIRRELFKYGPVSTAINIYQDFYALNPLQIYKYNGKSPLVGGHAVVLVGWGEEDGIKYWIVRNSWGTDWCDGGFCRVQRGVNMCNIEQNVYIGLPDFLTYDEDEPFDERSKYQRWWYTSIESVGGGRDPEYGYSRRVLHTQLPMSIDMDDLRPLVPESPYKDRRNLVVGRDRVVRHSNEKSYWIVFVVVLLFVLVIIGIKVIF